MRYITIIFGYLLSAVFIFSGVVKAVDPWGTAIKIGEYLSFAGLDFLLPATFAMSILLSGAELALGIALATGVLRRAVSFAVMIFMALFTLTTLYIAIYNPVEDCGCFGDALKLTNWQTLLKNIVLLPMSIILWRGTKGVVCNMRRNIVALCAIFVLSCSVGLYSFIYLPIIDFLPYKVGTDLSKELHNVDVGQGEVNTVLIYRSRQSGELRQFSLEDTLWRDDTKWEFVETKVDFGAPISHNSSEFAIFDATADVTMDMMQGEVYLLCLTNIDAVPKGCLNRLAGVVAQANKSDAKVVVVTPSELPDGAQMEIGQSVLPTYNIDATTLKTVIRAKNGVVELRDGVIVNKSNCR